MQMETRVDYVGMVRETVAEIQRRLDDPPTFRELADKAFLSPYHFHRIFRALVGESPAELLRRLRLERASWQIRQTDDSITEIAFDSGYGTHEAFTKAFQSEFGVAPSVFRTHERECTGIRTPNGLHYYPHGFSTFRLVYRGENPMKHEVVDMPAKRLAAVPYTGPYNQISPAFEKLGSIAGPLGLFRADTMYVGVYYDDPETKPADQLQAHAAVTVDEDAFIGDLEEARLPSGKFLRAEYIGPYTGLDEAWAKLYGKEVTEGGYTLREGVSFEVYVNDPTTTPAEQLVTHIYVPIT